MKKFVLIVSALMLVTGIAVVTYTNAQINPDTDQMSATLVRVTDGDTLVVNTVNGEERVRIIGIDSPELKGNLPTQPDENECGSLEAKYYLEDMLHEGDLLTLRFDPNSDRQDRYGRLLAYVESRSSQDVGAEMLLSGLAVAYYPDSEPEPDKYGQYVGYEVVAEAAGTGNWSSCG